MIWGLNQNLPADNIRSLLLFAIDRSFPLFALEPQNEAGAPTAEYTAQLVQILTQLYPPNGKLPRPYLMGADEWRDDRSAQTFLNNTARLGMPALAATYGPLL